MTYERRRIFVAVCASPELRAEIEAWKAKYERLPVRWISGKNLHITLVPPWYERKIDEVRDALHGVRGTPPFDISFCTVSYGPDPRRPRLIWVAGETPREMEGLKSEIEETLGQTPEKRPFRLHLTIARFRNEDFSGFPIRGIGERVAWQEHVRSFVLMESHLSPQGADYEVLEEFMF